MGELTFLWYWVFPSKNMAWLALFQILLWYLPEDLIPFLSLYFCFMCFIFTNNIRFCFVFKNSARFPSDRALCRPHKVPAAGHPPKGAATRLIQLPGDGPLAHVQSFFLISLSHSSFFFFFTNSAPWISLPTSLLLMCEGFWNASTRKCGVTCTPVSNFTR